VDSAYDVTFRDTQQHLPGELPSQEGGSEGYDSTDSDRRRHRIPSSIDASSLIQQETIVDGKQEAPPHEEGDYIKERVQEILDCAYNLERDWVDSFPEITKIIQIIRTQHEAKLKDMRVRREFIMFIQIEAVLQECRENPVLTEDLLRYLLALCRKSLDDTFVVACVLYILRYGYIQHNPVRSGELNTDIYDLLVELTRNHHVDYAAILSEVWKALVLDGDSWKKFLDLLFTDQDFASCFMTMMQCEVREDITFKDGCRRITIFCPRSCRDKYCFGIVRSNVFEVYGVVDSGGVYNGIRAVAVN
jgi:hypothetical protein